MHARVHTHIVCVCIVYVCIYIVCMHACMYVQMYMYVCACVCTHVRVCVHACACVSFFLTAKRAKYNLYLSDAVDTNYTETKCQHHKSFIRVIHLNLLHIIQNLEG